MRYIETVARKRIVVLSFASRCRVFHVLCLMSDVPRVLSVTSYAAFFFRKSRSVLAPKLTAKRIVETVVDRTAKGSSL